MTSEEGELGRPATRTEPVIRLEDLERGSAEPVGASRRRGTALALSSTDPEERARALGDLIRWGITEDDVRPISDLLLDPDLDVRRRAAESLVEVADLVETRMLERALEDPADEVRGAGGAGAAAALAGGPGAGVGGPAEGAPPTPAVGGGAHLAAPGGGEAAVGADAA